MCVWKNVDVRNILQNKKSIVSSISGNFNSISHDDLTNIL